MTEAKSATDVEEEGPVIVERYSDFESKYNKLRRLGKPGQYGETYLCTRKENTEPAASDMPDQVAVKIMDKSRFRAHGPSLYKKWIGFQRSEITTLLIARHENIVRLYDVLEDEGYVYLVMEYLAGEELLQWMVKRGKISEFGVANIVYQILSGLDYMHKRSMLHLDLKPENIMLVEKVEDPDTETPRIKLIDFGFATILPRLQKMDGRRGTPYYMAPEMLRGQYDRAVDVWATGVITFTMLFGFLPFFDDHGRNIRVIFRQIQLGFTPDVRRGCGAWFPESIPISEEGRNFIGGMLRSVAQERATVEECLASSWLRGHAPKDPLPEVAMRGLAQFTNAFQRKRKTTILVSDPALQRLGEELKQQSRERRDSMIEEYVNDEGLVEKEDFVRRMGSKMTSMRHLAVDNLFEAIDTDRDGAISIETMKRIEVFQTLIAADDRINELFDTLDLDHDGNLSAEEIEAAIQKMDDKSAVAQLVHVRSVFRETDTNGDGFIDREEFLRAIHPNFAPPTYDKTTRSIQTARAFASDSLRQRSELYYELLRQLEGNEEIAADESLGLGSQLTIPVAHRQATQKFSGGMSRQGDPRMKKAQSFRDGYDATYLNPQEAARRAVEKRLAEEQETGVKRNADGDIVINIGGAAQQNDGRATEANEIKDEDDISDNDDNNNNSFGGSASVTETTELKNVARTTNNNNNNNNNAGRPTSAQEVVPSTSPSNSQAASNNVSPASSLAIEQNDQQNGDCCLVM